MHWEKSSFACSELFAAAVESPDPDELQAVSTRSPAAAATATATMRVRAGEHPGHSSSAEPVLSGE
jgi:hypothetical protein